MPLAEVYYSIPGNLHIMWTNRTGEPSVEVTQACGRVGVGGVAVLPVPSNSGGWSSFERKGPRRRVPDARSGDKILAPTQWSGSRQFPQKAINIRLYTVIALRIVTHYASHSRNDEASRSTTTIVDDSECSGSIVTSHGKLRNSSCYSNAIAVRQY